MSLVSLYNEMKIEHTHQEGFTDKGEPYHTYIEFYESYFSPFKENVSLCEIGVNHGGSLELWKRYFTNYNLVGVDLAANPIEGKPYVNSLTTDKNIKLLFGKSSQDKDVADQIKDHTFDFLIDDGSHEMSIQLDTFKVWVKKVKKGGTYFIEDVFHPSLLDIMAQEIGNWCNHNGIECKITAYTGNPEKLKRMDDLILVINL